jgi:hypothetical protein
MGMNASQVLAEFDNIYKGECKSKLGWMESSWVKDNNGLGGKEEAKGAKELVNLITSYMV